MLKLELVLGSSSKWRAAVLEKRGVSFAQISPDIDEKAIRHRDPHQMVLRIARAKARAVAGKLIDKRALIIASDQVCLFGEREVREKPKDEIQALEFLLSYNRASVRTVTSVVVMDAATLEMDEGIDVATVHFGEIGLAAAQSAIGRGDVLESCGAFTVDDPDIGESVTYIEGEKESVEGLPLALTRRLLKTFGYDLP